MPNRLEFTQTLIRLDYLIGTKSTGSAETLANRLGVSLRTLKQYIQYMRECGAPITFSKERRSYIYLKPGKFKICFEHEKSTNELHQSI